jgi:hypothetical protein
MVASGLFSLVVLGVIACHLAGLRYTLFIQPKLLNAQYNRQTMDRLIEEIRSANSVQVGTGTLSSFTAAGPYSAQVGNALQIYPTTNLSSYIYYFHDSSTLKVWRVPQGMTNGGTAIALLVTNHWIFRMEDFSGNLLTNSQNNAVTGVTLQMLRLSAWYQISDATQVRTHITRRNIL